MALSSLFSKLFSTAAPAESSPLIFEAVANGLELSLPAEVFNQARQGYGPALAQHQYLRMVMLLEEGLAVELRYGIRLDADTAVTLDDDSRFLFNLPPRWPGRFVLRAQGLTTQPGFALQLLLTSLQGNARVPGEAIAHYRLHGPLLELSASEVFLPDPWQWLALSAVARHAALDGAGDEYQNLWAIHQVLHAAAHGLDVDMGAFGRFALTVPERVTLAVEVLADGSLELAPGLGQGLDQNAIQARLGQLRPGSGAQSLRVGNTLVLLNEKALAAAHNILSKRHIPASQRRKFLNAPGSYLDAALVDLDAGFTLRAKGIGPFQHAYFGETDNNEIEWFRAHDAGAPADLFDQVTTAHEDLIKPQDLPALLTDPALLADFQTKLTAAEAINATIVRLDDWRVDISEPARVRDALAQARALLANPPPAPPTQALAVEIHLNDQKTDFGSAFGSPEKDIQYNGTLDFSYYTRQPFPHQVSGVRWMLALATNQGQPLGAEYCIRGGLLADDMGLGKTYMAIVGIRETLLATHSRKPVLVVAPLSLLENWKRETAATYSSNFFSRIIVLQADGDLPKFRVAGRGVEIRARVHEPPTVDITDVDSPPWEDEPTAAPAAVLDQEEEALDFISLKIGAEWGPDRLDLPGTLVLTTYQTLRDYQFSLVAVPWSVVVLDEAQNIKSPNTLQTRAAKALDAEFKLLVTGTPVENHLGEFWCLFDTLQPGFLGAYQEFREQYIKPILKAPTEQSQEVRMDIGRQLRDRVGGLMLRRTKEEHLEGLPKKRIILGSYNDNGEFAFDPRIARDMAGRQRLRYDGVVADTMAGLAAQEMGGVVLGGLQRLRAVSLHPDLLDSGQAQRLPLTAPEAEAWLAESGKMQILHGILEEIRARDEKVLIFAVNKRLQEWVAMCLRRLYNLRAPIINGTTKAVSGNPNNPTRQGLIDEFQAQPGFGALVISPVAAGVGLTIIGANNVIHLERHWNPAKEAQATDRAYRIGQTRDVNVYIPILTHPDFASFDVNLNRLLSGKSSLKDAIITQEEVRADELAPQVFASHISGRQS